ncbi:hypothetical protein ACEPPN_016568 [Leptodophora sp. 'Broadleaf-Isolate-01']
MTVLLALLSLLALLPFTAADGLVSLDSSEGFNRLRSCALGCYNGGMRDGYLVADQIDCQKPGIVYVPPDNDCFCRPDLQETAVRYLSQCVSSSCSANQLDISSATQVYNDYCNAAGYTAALPKSVPAQTTSATTRTSTSAIGHSSTPVETGSVGSDVPTSDQSSGASKSGMSTGEMIGVIAGVVGAIAAVIGCIFKYKHYKRQRRL